MEKVFTIIVSYNGMTWLEKCLSSLRESTYPTEVIVIDNGSTDGSIDFIRENFAEVHLMESKKNLGFGKANNKGISYALKQGADYFFLLNQDAYVFPDTIGNLVSNFKQNPNYGIISPIQLKNKTEVENLFLTYLNAYPKLKENYNSQKEYPNEVLPIEFTNAALWMISKECIMRVGGFSPLFYHYGEDVDYVNRIKYHKFKNGVSCNAYGIHDREVKPRLTVSEYNKKKKHPGPWPLRYYIILANPNYSFFSGILRATKLFIFSLGKHLLRGNFFSVKYDFIVVKDVLNNFLFVRKIREKVINRRKSLFLK